MAVEVRRATDRFVTRAEGRTTWHSFSFGAHYDPGNVGFGPITALNDELLPPGTGYAEHLHRDVEIVTVVLEGALRHRDDSGRSDVLAPGQVSCTSAGSGLVHAEVTEPGVGTRFLQSWLRPDEPGGVPAYSVAEVVPELDPSSDQSSDPRSGPGAGLVEAVGPDGPLAIRVAGARLHVGRLDPGRTLLPDAPLVHVFVVDGAVTVGDHELHAGDAARLTDEGGRALDVASPGLVLVWSLPRSR